MAPSALYPQSTTPPPVIGRLAPPRYRTVRVRVRVMIRVWVRVNPGWARVNP